MPIYEEKLICPLAVRFTQEHIRPVFQDDHEIEAAIEAIRPRPGTEDYDIVLEAPFPNIEILRWHQKGPGSADPDVNHWFTLDNRRLYCLQRVAVAYWPRRVGATVEVLYNATDGIWRKDDSSTAGCSVSIGHSLKAIVARWSWRDEAGRARTTDAGGLRKLRLPEVHRAAPRHPNVEQALAQASLGLHAPSSDLWRCRPPFSRAAEGRRRVLLRGPPSL